MQTLRLLALTGLIIASAAPRAAAQSAIDKVLDAWKSHRIVAVGEVHRGVEDKRFLAQVIAHPKFSRIVDDIVIEFGTARYQSTLDRYINGDDVPLAEVRKVWADTTAVNGVWDAPIYAEFLAGVRESNKRAPKGRRVRVLACDPPIDWARVSTIEDAKSNLDREGHCTALVEREVIARRHRALMIMGDAHVVRTTIIGQKANNTVTRIESAHPRSTYVILTYYGQFKESPAIEARLDAGPVPAFVPSSEAWLGDLPAVPPHKPTRTRVGGGKEVSETLEVARQFTFREMADALVYLGPKAALTRSVPDPSRWTEEELNELERRHQILFGKPLDRGLLFKE